VHRELDAVRNLTALEDDGYVHLEVVLQRDGGDTICGTVGDRDGRRTPFTGWLELMSAFDTARAAPLAGADAPGSDS